MASRKRKFRQKPDYDPFDDLDEIYDDNFDVREIAPNYSRNDLDDTRWHDRISARRKIERRREHKRLNFELDYWDGNLDSAES